MPEGVCERGRRKHSLTTPGGMNEPSGVMQMPLTWLLLFSLKSCFPFAAA